MYLFLGCCLPLPPSPPPLTGVELGSERSSAWPLAALANGRGQRVCGRAGLSWCWSGYDGEKE